MKITKIEFIGNRKPLSFGTPLRFCFEEPDVRPILSHGFSLFRVHTDDGIIGTGPTIAPNVDAMIREFVIGKEPSCVTELFERFMGARGLHMGKMPISGLEIALWDIIGQAKGLPLFRLFGAVRDRVPAYCSLVQLHPRERLIELAHEALASGFRAIKIRFHRVDPREDLETAQALRVAVGDRLGIMVDANQSNASLTYPFWSYDTARWMARELEALNVLWLEEPLPRHEEEDLARLCGEVAIPIAGGEHHETWELFRNAMKRDVYDIIQPDACLSNLGISGLRRLAALAEESNKGFSPHVLFWGNHPLYLAATLHVLGAIRHNGWLEYIHDPPTVTPENQQPIARRPLLVEPDGCVKIPERSGLGVELDEDFIARMRGES